MKFRAILTSVSVTCAILAASSAVAAGKAHNNENAAQGLAKAASHASPGGRDLEHTIASDAGDGNGGDGHHGDPGASGGPNSSSGDERNQAGD